MPDFPFASDGCSGGMSWAWRTFINATPPWEDCCKDHDELYWQGGTREDRLWADVGLLVQVAQRRHPLIAIAMFLAVRIGGHPLLPTPWRWGYGWKYPRGYTPKEEP